jgi:hypothetical protein
MKSENLNYFKLLFFKRPLSFCVYNMFCIFWQLYMNIHSFKFHPIARKIHARFDNNRKTPMPSGLRVKEVHHRCHLFLYYDMHGWAVPDSHLDCHPFAGMPEISVNVTTWRVQKNKITVNHGATTTYIQFVLICWCIPPQVANLAFETTATSTCTYCFPLPLGKRPLADNGGFQQCMSLILLSQFLVYPAFPVHLIPQPALAFQLDHLMSMAANTI